MLHSVAVILPTFNNLNSLKNCLNSLTKQTVLDFKAYVCVDGSTDGTLEFLYSTSFNFEIEILEHIVKKNRGRQATRNLALKRSKESFILFLDTDLEVNSNWIEEHLNALNDSPITIGRVNFINTNNPWVDYYNSRGFNSCFSPKKVSAKYYISANTGFKKEVFEKVGLMDESIQVYGGDAEFALRLLQFGFNTVSYLPEAISFGIEEKTVSEAIVQYEQFSRHLLKHLINQYPKNQDFYNYQKLMYFKWLKCGSLNYFGEILDNEQPSRLTRFGIRIALTLAIIKELR